MNKDNQIEEMQSDLENHTCMSNFQAEIAARMLYAKGYRKQEWISVAERLPENDYEKHWKDRQYYLVITAPSGLMRVAHYGYKEHDWWIDSHDTVLDKRGYKEVTHWMPLPEAPKGESNGKSVKR